jgi:hypothetical protein
MIILELIVCDEVTLAYDGVTLFLIQIKGIVLFKIKLTTIFHVV